MSQISIENYEQIQASKCYDFVEGLIDGIGWIDVPCLGLDMFSFNFSRLCSFEDKKEYGFCISIVSDICTSFQPKYKITVYSFQDSEILPVLDRFLQVNIPFVMCNAKPILHKLWDYGLRGPHRIWDIAIYERANSLGKININYQIKEQGSYSEKLIRQLESEKAQMVSVPNIINHYGINTSYSNSPYPSLTQVAQNMVTYANIYLAQVENTSCYRTLNHMTDIEMPWVITNAQIEYNGVRVDTDLRKQYVDAYKQHVPRILQKLQDKGLRDIGKDECVRSCLRKYGVLKYFETPNGYSINKDTLKNFLHIHPIIKEIADAKKIIRIQNQQIMNAHLPMIDGRVRATHTQLATETGRQSAVEPNLLGLDKLLRTLIIPDEGNGIAEVDLSQIEVGIAAAYHRDENMIQAFNTGDVYSAMAQRFYAGELTEADRILSGQEFKQKFPDKRNLLKRCTLSILYGGGVKSLAASLEMSTEKARRMIEAFYALFPDLKRGLDQVVRESLPRGYVHLISGLRIYLDPKISDAGRQRMCRNYPIQGSAAVVFKHAGNQLSKLYKEYNAKILIPLHDSYVFEAPLQDLPALAERTSEIMCESVRDYFPQLLPRTEITIAHPERWTKEDDIGVIDRWITYGKI